MSELPWSKMSALVGLICLPCKQRRLSWGNQIHIDSMTTLLLHVWVEARAQREQANIIKGQLALEAINEHTSIKKQKKTLDRQCVTPLCGLVASMSLCFVNSNQSTHVNVLYSLRRKINGYQRHTAAQKSSLVPDGPRIHLGSGRAIRATKARIRRGWEKWSVQVVGPERREEVYCPGGAGRTSNSAKL